VRMVVGVECSIVWCIVEIDVQPVESLVESSSRQVVRWGRRMMQCDSQYAVSSGQCLAQSCAVRPKRCADEAGKAATIAIADGDIDGYVSVGTTRTAARTRVSMYFMHASRMVGAGV
jgi:hypothetical protein